ncbi:MAG: single-stranded DNA-binding protein [Nitrospirae bacterium]|nr:MAG: single-stranded DNA-binding protein [Nitrospirota bacterium]
MACNVVILQGRLTRDPEVRYTTNGTPVSGFTVAVDGYKKGDEARTEFIDVTVFGKQAETAGQYLTKGQEVLVTGRLQLQRWETQDGSRRSKLQVIANRISFGAKPRQAQPQAA